MDNSLARYDAYKDSGVEWLGEIPTHWEVSRLGSYFKERRKKVSDTEYKPLSVTKMGIFPQWENVAKSNDGDNRKLVKKGDFVINSRSDRKGSSGIAFEDGSVSLINIVMKPLGMRLKFCNYLLKSNAFVEENYRIGHGIVADLWTTRYDEMKNIKIVVPNISEQTAIANYLDDKTAKIDQAISLKTQLIERLKERKQILIQNAVTKGLNPDVPFKDSGVEWIGDIPAHWEVKKLKYICDFDTGNKDTIDSIKNGKYPLFVRSPNVERLNEYTHDCEAVFTSGDGAGVGKIFHYYVGKFAFHQRVYMFTKFREINGKFFYFYFSNLFHHVALDGSAKSTVDSLRKNTIENFPFLIPTKEEQSSILRYLKGQQQKIDTAITQQQTQIEHLTEYRATLIDSAVTGKIKVC